MAKKENKISVIPRIGKIYSIPIIGSGKISRRVVVRSIHHKPKNQKRRNDFSGLFPSISNNERPWRINPNLKRNQKPLDFGNPAAKIIFEYWNRKSFPFVHHKPYWTKVSANAIEKTNKALRSKTKSDIINSIDLIHDMFYGEWFRYKQYFLKNRLSLQDFYSYSTSQYQRIKKQIPDCPRSWFKEALKGTEYCKQKYTTRLRDTFPHISEPLIAAWKKYSGQNTLPQMEINNLIICSKKLDHVAKTNNLDWLLLVKCIDNMLNKWKNYKPKHTGYLRNEIFWTNDFPKELVRYGVLRRMGDLQ